MNSIRRKQINELPNQNLSYLLGTGMVMVILFIQICNSIKVMIYGFSIAAGYFAGNISEKAYSIYNMLTGMVMVNPPDGESFENALGFIFEIVFALIGAIIIGDAISLLKKIYKRRPISDELNSISTIVIVQSCMVAVSVWIFNILMNDTAGSSGNGFVTLTNVPLVLFCVGVICKLMCIIELYRKNKKI